MRHMPLILKRNLKLLGGFIGNGEPPCVRACESSIRKHNDGPCRQANHDVWFKTGEKRMRTPKSEHAHNWAQKFKNACARWHSTDLRGHDDPWTRRTRAALTGTEREASAHYLRESISAAALRTKVHGSMGKKQRTYNRLDESMTRCGTSRAERWGQPIDQEVHSVHFLLRKRT